MPYFNSFLIFSLYNPNYTQNLPVDENFNASEDLAESFSSIIFPDQAKDRAQIAASRMKGRFDAQDWGKTYQGYYPTPREKLILEKLREQVSTNKQA